MAAVACSLENFAVFCGKALFVYNFRGELCYRDETAIRISATKPPPKATSSDDQADESGEKKREKVQDSGGYTAGSILAHAFSGSGKYLAIADDHKQLSVYTSEPSWTHVSTREVIRRASAITFLNEEDCVILADKSGDIYSFSLRDLTEPGKLLMGHLSMVLDVTSNGTDQYIMTCDRDEKIRVSCYPNTYNVHTYCLGHTEYVIKLEYLPEDDLLISASGDGTVRFWDYRSGKELFRIDAGEDVESKVPIRNIKYFYPGRCVIVTFDRSDVAMSYELSKEHLRVTRKHKVTLSGPAIDTCIRGSTLYVLQELKDHPLKAFNLRGVESDSGSEMQEITDEIVRAINENTQWDLGSVLPKSGIFPNLKKNKVDNTNAYVEKKRLRVEQRNKTRTESGRKGGGKMKLTG